MARRARQDRATLRQPWQSTPEGDAHAARRAFPAPGGRLNERLDRALRRLHPGAGRAAVGRAIASGQVLVNGRVVRLSSWMVEADDIVTVRGPLLTAVPLDGPVVFEPAWLLADDGDIIAVDKPAGLRPEAVRLDDDRPNLLGLARASGAVHDSERLALAHRLDRDTSGVMLLTRPGPIRAELDRAFKAHAVVKEYRARIERLGALLVGKIGEVGEVGEVGIIDSRIGPDPTHRARMAVVERGGDRARTRYQVIGDLLVGLWPETGRTHQLRVQLASLGAPIVGDRLYGPDNASASRLMLHACRVTLPDGRSFAAPIPVGFEP